MANRKAVLLWYCRTPKGWRRFPIVMGGNNRVKTGYVIDKQGTEHYYPKGRFEIRTYEGSRPIYKRVRTDKGADALAARDREISLLTAKYEVAGTGAKVVEEQGRINLRAAAVSFEDDARDRKALEAAEVNRLVCDEFLDVTGCVYADEISRDSVLKFHRALRARGCSDRTVANKHKRLRSFLIFLKIDYKEFLPPTPKYDKTLPTKYSKVEAGRILAAADDYMRLVIELGLQCGLRDQELMHLEWSDIDWHESVLRVTSKLHWKFKVKDSEERDISIPDTLLQHLQEWQNKHADTKLVLPTKAGKPDGKLLRRLKRLAKANGLNCGQCDGCKAPLGECGQWTLHKLRRTYATTLLQSGFDLATVQRLMGHSDLESTMRYLSPSSAKETRSRINGVQWTS
jgi:integrase